MAEGRCPEKALEISTYITPGSNTSVRSGIRLYALPKLLVFSCWERQSPSAKKMFRAYSDLERKHSMEPYSDSSLV